MNVYDEKDLPWYLIPTPFFISFLLALVSLIILTVKRKQCLIDFL